MQSEASHGGAEKSAQQLHWHCVYISRGVTEFRASEVAIDRPCHLLCEQSTMTNI